MDPQVIDHNPQLLDHNLEDIIIIEVPDQTQKDHLQLAQIEEAVLDLEAVLEIDHLANDVINNF